MNGTPDANHDSESRPAEHAITLPPEGLKTITFSDLKEGETCEITVGGVRVSVRTTGSDEYEVDLPGGKRAFKPGNRIHISGRAEDEESFPPTLLELNNAAGELQIRNGVAHDARVCFPYGTAYDLPC